MGRTFNVQTDIPDLSGKVVLVTGGNIGLGLATIDALAAHNPARIFLCARRRDSAEEAAAKVRAKHGEKTNISILDLDLASFDSVKKCAQEFHKQSDRLDLLFLNAGVSAVAPGLTKEGFETTFGINHMGHALLAQYLLPTVRKTGREVPGSDPRVVVLSSKAALYWKGDKLMLDKMRKEIADVPAMTRYGHSKLVNVLFARKLATLYPDITAVSVHPGLVSTDIFRKADDPGVSWLQRTFFGLAVRFGSVQPDEGVWTQLWAATAPKRADGVQNGGFYMPVGKLYVDERAENPKVVDTLWDWTTEQLATHGGPGWPSP